MSISSRNGKICYVQIPSTDVARSAKFYETVFGWEVRRRDNGELTFHDGVEVSGAWITDRPPSASGLVISIMVDDIKATIAKVEANGGEIVRPLGADAPELTAHFRDPGGSYMGLYQEPVQS